MGADAENTGVSDSTAPPRDPIRAQSVLKGFLLLTKQLQVFKESWAQRRLGVQMFRMPSLYQQCVNLYRYYGKFRNSEIFITFRQLCLAFINSHLVICSSGCFSIKLFLEFFHFFFAMKVVKFRELNNTLHNILTKRAFSTPTLSVISYILHQQMAFAQLSFNCRW